VLEYHVLVHLCHVTDFDPEDPSPPPSPPEFNNNDSGHDGIPDKHHFSRSSGPRIQGFRCTRGVVDSEPATSPNLGSGIRGGANVSRQGLVLHQQKAQKKDASRGILHPVLQSANRSQMRRVQVHN
jgi:hypothetical protein